MKKKIDPYYIASIPERIIRSTVSGATGLTSILTQFLLPKPVKESATYKVTFGMLQQFLIEQVAQVEKESEVELKDNYLVRKTAGSVLEGIGLLSVRFSPVWMLAILSDVTGGSKVYFENLEKELKANGLVETEMDYSNAYELLDGISKTSQKGVSAIDTPPISIEELKEFKNEMAEQFKENNNSTYKLYKDLELVYGKMDETGKSENMSISQLNGAMTLDLMRNATKKGLDITMVTAQSSLELLNREVVESYKESLELLNHIGKRKYFIEHMTPFVKQMAGHMDKEHGTLTETLLEKIFKVKEDRGEK